MAEALFCTVCIDGITRSLTLLPEILYVFIFVDLVKYGVLPLAGEIMWNRNDCYCSYYYCTLTTNRSDLPKLEYCTWRR